MESFLEEVARYLWRRHGDGIARLRLVFPNQRAKIFFRHLLGQVAGQTTLAPKDSDWLSFAARLAGLQVPDDLQLLFELFGTYRAHWPSASLDFERFHPLGKALLDDFSEMDDWLVDSDRLFRNMAELKELDDPADYLSPEQREILERFWAEFSAARQSQHKEWLVRFWNGMPSLQARFREQLAARGLAYSGAVSRALADGLASGRLRAKVPGQVAFIGFNALTRAQRAVFRQLKQDGNALFFWDFDPWYVEDPAQEAGLYLRENLRQMPAPDDFRPQSALAQPKNVRLLGVPLRVGQAKVVPLLLEAFGASRPGVETAVVLADEKLLFPTLHALPQGAEKVNVTMGYPLKETSIFGLLDKYLQMVGQASLKPESPSFRHDQVLMLLAHPLVADSRAELVGRIRDEMAGENLIYPRPDFFQRFDDPIVRVLFGAPTLASAEDALARLLELCYLLFEQKNQAQREADLEHEYLYLVYRKAQLLKSLLHESQTPLTVRAAFEIFRKELSTATIPFNGEPLGGMQVMGLLETRNLDFQNVVLLGFNEGAVGMARRESLLPESLRRAYGLPTASQQDAITAYLFYRLAQRAQNIALVYDSALGQNAKEMSRYALQALHELPWKIRHQQLDQQMVPAATPSITVAKSPEILQAIQQFQNAQEPAARRLSATAINTYLACHLKFYFRYVLQLKEPEEINDKTGPQFVGQVLHRALELLYGQWLGKTLDAEGLRLMKGRLGQALEQALREILKTPEEKPLQLDGNQLVLRQIAKLYLQKVLDHDLGQVPLQILAVEDQQFNGNITTPSGKEFALTGIVDRLDRKGDSFRLIDYKTGGDKLRFKDLDGVFEQHGGSQYKVVLQTLLYLRLFRQARGNPPAEPHVYALRELDQQLFDTRLVLGKLPLDHALAEAILPEFWGRLGELLDELADPELPFDQTPERKTCEFCAYQRICARD